MKTFNKKINETICLIWNAESAEKKQWLAGGGSKKSAIAEMCPKVVKKNMFKYGKHNHYHPIQAHTGQ